MKLSKINLSSNPKKSRIRKSISIRVEEIPHNEFLQLLPTDFSSSVFVYNLHIWCDISGCGLELLVHCTITIHKPFGYLNWFAYSVSIAVVGLNYFPLLLAKCTWRDFGIISGRTGRRFIRGYGWFRSLCWLLDFGRIGLGSRNCSWLLFCVSNFKF